MKQASNFGYEKKIHHTEEYWNKRERSKYSGKILGEYLCENGWYPVENRSRLKDRRIWASIEKPVIMFYQKRWTVSDWIAEAEENERVQIVTEIRIIGHSSQASLVDKVCLDIKNLFHNQS
jgi:hypothetical protein